LRVHSREMGPPPDRMPGALAGGRHGAKTWVTVESIDMGDGL
jgi:hypothetical protein